MSNRRPAVRALFLFVVAATLSLVTVSANAQMSCGIASPAIKITSYVAPYSSVFNAQGLSIYESEFLRAQGMTELAAKYRSTHPGALPKNSFFKVIWGDTTRECAVVGFQPGTTTLVAEPVPATQREARGDTNEPTTVMIHTSAGSGGGPNSFPWMCFDYYSNGILTQTICM